MDENKNLNEVEEASIVAELTQKCADLEAQNNSLTEAKRKYYDAVLNGNTPKEEEVVLRSAKEIRKDLFKEPENLSNREYARLVVELDDACIRETGESCFLPKGKNITPTVDERDVAKRMNAALRECVDNSKSDEEFNRLFSGYIKK